MRITQDRCDVNAPCGYQGSRNLSRIYWLSTLAGFGNAYSTKRRSLLKTSAACKGPSYPQELLKLPPEPNAGKCLGREFKGQDSELERFRGVGHGLKLPKGFASDHVGQSNCDSPTGTDNSTQWLSSCIEVHPNRLLGHRLKQPYDNRFPWVVRLVRVLHR